MKDYVFFGYAAVALYSPLLTAAGLGWNSEVYKLKHHNRSSKGNHDGYSCHAIVPLLQKSYLQYIKREFHRAL